MIKDINSYTLRWKNAPISVSICIIGCQVFDAINPCQCIDVESAVKLYQNGLPRLVYDIPRPVWNMLRQMADGFRKLKARQMQQCYRDNELQKHLFDNVQRPEEPFSFSI